MDKKVVILITAVLIGVSLYVSQEESKGASQFQVWKEEFGITFDSEIENRFREKIFMKKLAEVNRHNSDPQRTYDKGINHFSHLTSEEFSHLYRRTIQDRSQYPQIKDDLRLGDVDWQLQGAVTQVKEQGKCSSFWAFSTTGLLEGLHKITEGNLQSFSEQQLIDCSQHYGTYGCNGGIVDNALKYVKDKGIVQELQYMYEARQEACRKDGGPFKVSGYVDITNNCNDLANAILQRPIAVKVATNNWQDYRGGIWKHCSRIIDSQVLLVGITDQNWRIKNSWGTRWGENGYMRLARGNTCEICAKGTYALPVN